MKAQWHYRDKEIKQQRFDRSRGDSPITLCNLQPPAHLARPGTLPGWLVSLWEWRNPRLAIYAGCSPNAEWSLATCQDVHPEHAHNATATVQYTAVRLPSSQLAAAHHDGEAATLPGIFAGSGCNPDKFRSTTITLTLKTRKERIDVTQTGARLRPLTSSLLALQRSRHA